MFKCNNSGEIKHHSKYNKSNFLYKHFSATFRVDLTDLQKIILSLNLEKKYTFIKEKTPRNTVTKNNKIQLIIMDIIQSYYTFSKKIMQRSWFFCLLLFCLLLFRIELSVDVFNFLKVNGEMLMCFPDLIFKCLSVSP